jgi:hypothetical protein
MCIERACRDTTFAGFMISHYLTSYEMHERKRA